MPELPEVETMRRGVAPIVGSRIQKASAVRGDHKPITISPSPAAMNVRLMGRRIEAADRIGKRVVLRIEGNQSLIFEPRMTGLVLLADPPNQQHLRFSLELKGGPARRLWYWDRRGLGSVRLLSAAQLARRYGPDKLGPDALDVTAEQLAARLGDSPREIKPALLDQRAVAGIGNLYAAEILHRAGIHPQRRCDRLKADDWRRIRDFTREVLEEAIEHEGSTLSDGTYRSALNQSGGYQNYHRVYDREGKACLACRTLVVRIVQAQRATFFCPACQPRR